MFICLKTFIIFSKPCMGEGLFRGTLYIIHEPVHVEKLNIRLNHLQNALVDNILSTECIRHLTFELGAVSHGVIYHKDRYEKIPGATVEDY